jgi:hypothetical protein
MLLSALVATTDLPKRGESSPLSGGAETHACREAGRDTPVLAVSADRWSDYGYPSYR